MSETAENIAIVASVPEKVSEIIVNIGVFRLKQPVPHRDIGRRPKGGVLDFNN
jgi:hypothetical protein